jgi:hypothetical protein
MRNSARMLAIAFFSLFVLDSFSALSNAVRDVELSRSDVIRLWLTLATGVGLLCSVWWKRLVLNASLLFALALIADISIVAATTSWNVSIVSLLLSRHGILIWFTLGLAAAAMLEVLLPHDGHTQPKWIKRISLVVLGVTALAVVRFSLQAIEAPAFTSSYQTAADNAIVLIIATYAFLLAVWGGTIPLIGIIGLIASGTTLVGAVALANSTMIVGFWVGFAGLVFLGEVRKRSAAQSAFLIVVVLGISTMAVQLLPSSRYVRETRFASIESSPAELSSITTRTALLPTFSEQFAVSPIFGHFEAEIRAGTGTGNYVHSFPLSILTHTGAFGFTIFIGVLVSLWGLRRRIPRIVAVERKIDRVLLLVLALATVATFLTWSVAWFALGLSSRLAAPDDRKVSS